MYYYGYFRSLDTSVDPQGQQYKVVILTDWNGSGNPYPYKAVTDTISGAVRTANIPDEDSYVELTLTDHPFVVTYDEDKIHKPHRCSTAAVSFIQSDFNTNFYDATGRKCLVALLKKNYNVEKPAGWSSYINHETGERLYKTGVYWSGTSVLAWQGFNMENIDAFCYTTEWIGLATPDVLNTQYSHIEEKFTLTAQDAYSTLKYKKYQFEGDSREFNNLLRNAKETVLSMIANLGVYKNVYITNTVKFIGETDTALSSLSHQQWNWFDENNEPDEDSMKPVSELTVIDNILNYLNLTAVPWQDSVIITTPEAIAGGFNTYYSYKPQYSINNIVGISSTYRNFVQGDDTYLTLGHDIIIDDFNGPSMTISTEEVFNSSKVIADEYPIGNLIPDFDDDHNIVSKSPDGKEELSNNYYFKDANTRMYWYWEHECFWPNKENYIHGEDVDFYYYPYSYSGPGWGTQPIENPSWFGFGAQLTVTPFACVLDDGGFQIGTDKTESKCLSSPYNPTRKIYFSTPQGNGNRGDYGDYGTYNGQSHHFKYWQPMFHVRTKPFVASGKMWFAIKGKWKFYDSGVVTALRTIPQQTTETANSTIRDAKMGAGMGFIPMRIRVGNKYLYNSSIYRWSNSERDCQMFVDLGGETYSNIKAFDHEFQFEHTLRNFSDGFYWPIPISEDDELKPMDIEIWFSRPIGVSQYLCNCATLEDFGIYVYSDEYIASRKGKDSYSDTNTEYKATFDEDIVNANEDVEIKLSSNNIKGPRYSQMVAGNSTDGYRAVTDVNNAATAHTFIPEQGMVESIMRQHKRPYLTLEDDYHNNFSPISKLRWPTRMGNKRFVPKYFEIDYEYENIRAGIREIGINVETPNVTTCNITRNLRRRGDVINSDAVLWRERRTLESSADITIDDFTASLSESNEHWNITSDTPHTANVMFQPVFEDGGMVVSIPDEIDDALKLRIDDDGHLLITNNGIFPAPIPDDPPIPPIPPIPDIPDVPRRREINEDVIEIID